MSDETAPVPEAIDTKLVRQLADILKRTGLTEIEVERGDLKIRVARQMTVSAPAAAFAAAPAAAEPSVTASAAPSEAAPAAARGETVKSPMVGTVYLQSAPGESPFIRVGDRISAGQTLLIVEAMKTMNPIPAPRDGVVLEVLAEDGQPVEFGEPLVILE